MVFILDDGAYFNAPLDKIWKTLEAHGADRPKIHSDDKNSLAQPPPPNLLPVTAISVERADFDVCTADMSRIGAVIHLNYYLH